MRRIPACLHTLTPILVSFCTVFIKARQAINHVERPRPYFSLVALKSTVLQLESLELQQKVCKRLQYPLAVWL